MVKVAIIQPSFLPWSGYFNLIKSCDVFIFLDTVQYTRRDWRSRNRFKLSSGSIYTLSIPVRSRGRPSLNTVEIDLSHFNIQKILRFFSYNYQQAPYFSEGYSLVCEIFKASPSALSTFCISSTEILCSYLNINTPLLRASSLPVTTTDPTERLIQLCRLAEGTCYISGQKGREYLEQEFFNKAGIQLEFQEFPPPYYPQIGPPPFCSHLSIIDLIFNTGKSAANFL